MTLPVGQLSRSAFTLGADSIAIRSLSRAEAFELKAYTEDVDEAEIRILMAGCDETRESVIAFRASHNAGSIEKLMTAILDLSGLSAQITENGSGPKG